MGLPPRFVGILRCPDDNSGLRVESSDRPSDQPIFTGSLACEACGKSYPIENGILRLLELKQLTEEAQFEVSYRDTQAADMEWNREFESRLSSRLEVPQHVAALTLDSESVLLELACGRGRFTAIFNKICRSMVAVDFSFGSLQFVARRLGPDADVCLIQADITRLRFKPQSFNRAFSTSSLDSREERLTMYRNVAEALDDRGIFVFSAEHYDLRTRLLGNPRLMQYRGNGSLFERMPPQEVVREPAPYFMHVKSRPIQIFVPSRRVSSVFSRLIAGGTLSRSCGDLLVGMIRSIERVPVLKNFGDLLLIVATNPIRTAELNLRTKGSRLFQFVYRKLKLYDATP